MPDCLGYLAARFWKLNELREYEMGEPKPFTVPFIEGGARLFGWQFTPLDSEGLIALDRAYRHPGDEDVDGEA